MLKIESQQTVNIWLDDIRPAPSGYIWCKSVKEAQNILLSKIVENMSLDHDLGTKQNGYDLVKWMAANNKWPKNKPIVHSRNPVGQTNMESVIDRYGPY